MNNIFVNLYNLWFTHPPNWGRTIKSNLFFLAHFFHYQREWRVKQALIVTRVSVNNRREVIIPPRVYIKSYLIRTPIHGVTQVCKSLINIARWPKSIYFDQWIEIIEHLQTRPRSVINCTKRWFSVASRLRLFIYMNNKCSNVHKLIIIHDIHTAQRYTYRVKSCCKRN